MHFNYVFPVPRDTDNEEQIGKCSISIWPLIQDFLVLGNAPYRLEAHYEVGNIPGARFHSMVANEAERNPCLHGTCK